MDAVILLARFAALTVAGLPQLDRLVLTAAAAGCGRVYLVGRQAAEAAASLGARASAAVPVEAVDPSANPHAQYEAIRASGRILVLHTEVALDHGYLRGLVNFAADTLGEIFAVVDGDAPPHAAASPLMSNGAPAHTIGVMVLDALDAGSLSQGIGVFRALVTEAQRPGATPPALYRAARGYAGLLGSEADAASAEPALIEAAGKESDGVVSRTLNRRVSGAATRLLLKTRITPNAITAALLVLGIVTGLVLLQGSHVAVVIGTLLYQINSMLDGCDGEIARVRFETSRFGAWADTLCDQIVNLSFFLALPLGLYRRTGDTVHLMLALFTIFGVATLLAAVYVKSRRISDDAHFSDYGSSIARSFPAGSLAARIVAAVSAFLRRDSYALLFFVLALLGADAAIAYIIAGGIALHFVSLAMPATARSGQGA